MSSSTPNTGGGGGHQTPRSSASTAAAMAAAAGASYQGNQLVFVVNPLPSTEEQLNERILDSAERLRNQSTTTNNNSTAPNPIPVITIRDDPTPPTLSGGPPSSMMINDDTSMSWTTASSSHFQTSQSRPTLDFSQGTSLTEIPPSTTPTAEQQQMPRPSVLQCVISHGYVAVLLEDHRVCRFQYNIYPERIAAAETSSKSSLSASGTASSSHRLSSPSGGSSSLGGGGGGSSARTVQTARRRLIRSSSGRGPRGGPTSATSAAAASVIMSRAGGAVIPAQFVPEDLINQAQVVLQGKSRNVIIRELQRTNLDVNLAVNNLLSRDDEEYDEGEDGGPEQMIQSDDLMSLLDSGFGNESVIIDSDFADEVFSYPLRIRSSSSALFSGSSSSGAGGVGTGSGSSSNAAAPTVRAVRESRLRDEAFSFIERDFMSSGGGGGSGGSGGQKSRWYSYPSVEKSSGGFDSLSSRKRLSSTAAAANDSSSNVQLAPISFTSEGGQQLQEFWPTPADAPDRKFVAIASLTSELVAVTAKGELCQWRWADAEPFRGQLPDGTVYWHPRAPALGLVGGQAGSERVTLVAGSCIRATVATESGKLATWIDESIAPVASKLEHPATSSIFEQGSSGSSSSLNAFQSPHHHSHHHHPPHQQQNHRITALHVSSLMSVVQLSSGAIYWWGVPPFAHRKKLVEKVKNERSGGGSSSASKSSKSKSSSTSSKPEEIVLGSLVCMRNSPLYQAGSIAFTTVGGLPKVGQLVNSAWKITDSCSFRVLSPAEIAARGQPTTPTGKSSTVSNNGKTPSSEELQQNSKTVEMPPPPSPASSTSSEPGSLPLPKRAKRSSNNSGGGSSSGTPESLTKVDGGGNQGAMAIDRVEMWSLKDIVFMEDVRNLPVGRVIKVDGNYVAVKFTGGQSSNSSNSSTMIGETLPPAGALTAGGSSSSRSMLSFQEHSILFQAAIMGGSGEQRSGGYSPGGPKSSGGSSQGSSTSTTMDASKTGGGSFESFTYENFMQDCRLMRKDELTVVKPPIPQTSSATSTSAGPSTSTGVQGSSSATNQGVCQQQQQQTGAANPLGSKAANDCLQRYPKRVHLPENVQILAMTLSNLGLHCIAKIGGYRFSYILVNIVTGRVESDAKIPIEYSTFFGGNRVITPSGSSSSSTSKIALYCAGETDSTTVVLCRDGNGTLYPLAKDCTETLIRDPIALNLGPVSTIGLGIFGLPGSMTAGGSNSSNSSSSKTHAAIVGLAFEPQLLMSAILKSDLDLVRQRLELLEAAPDVFGPMVGELCDGNHNILHIAVSACFPTSNKAGGGSGGGSSSSSGSSGSSSSTSVSSGAGASNLSSATSAAERLISNMFESDEILNLQVMSLDQPENSSSSSNKETATSEQQQQQSTSMDTSNTQTQNTQNQHHNHHNSPDHISEPPLDPSEQKPIAHSILWTLLDSQALQPYLLGLLSARDFNGLTPFMFAVSGRAYSAAIQLLLIMQRVARQAASAAMAGFDQGQGQGGGVYSTYLADLVKRTLETMLYPRGSLPDHSPLYMLCSNDTCSFTWTGEEHINQDIFECRTCGLVGSLCCCTECARVCHRGHDCKLKRTSPTAYCDCWEKCKCKALIGGCQPARFALLKKLLETTDLSLRPNARGEHLLLFLVQTVGRQIGEQRQYRPIRCGPAPRSSLSSRKSAAASASAALADEDSNQGGAGGGSSVPDHDLEPPKFARRALEKLLGDWATVKSMILTGYRAPPEIFKSSTNTSTSNESNGKRRRNSSNFTSSASTSTSASSPTTSSNLQLFNSGSFFSGTAAAYALEEENAYLGRQNGSALLDKFTHSLLRIGLEMIERLIGTLLAACSNQLPEAKIAARRFVRSVARVGLVVAFELNPTAYASLVPMMAPGGGGVTLASIAGTPAVGTGGSIGSTSFGTMMEQALSGSRSAANASQSFSSYLFSKRGKGSSNSSLSSLGSSGSSSQAASDMALAILGKCRRIFVSFLPIAIEELCEVAESLIVPVKRGLARPSGAFVLAPSSSEVLAATEELFNVDASVLQAHQQRDFLDSAFGLGGSESMEVPPPPVVLPAPVPPPTTSSLVVVPPPTIQPPVVVVPPPPTSSTSNFSGAFPPGDRGGGSSSGAQDLSQSGPSGSSRAVVDPNIINEEAMDILPPNMHEQQQQLLGMPEEEGAGIEEASSEAAASSVDGSEGGGAHPPRRHQMNMNNLLEDMLADEDSQNANGRRDNAGGNHHQDHQDPHHPHHHHLHHHHQHHLHPPGVGNGVGGGEDSDSDSESNPDDAASYLSNADNASMAQRSVVTGATAGSDVGVSSLPYDDESVMSPGEDGMDDDDDEEGDGGDQDGDHEDREEEEDDDDEDGGSDASDTVETENEGDEIQFIDDGAGPAGSSAGDGSRIITVGGGGRGNARNNILHHVQWALRQRNSGDPGTSTSGISALDGSAASFRRAVAANQQASALVSTTGENVISMANSAVGLARAFSIVVRQIGDLMPVLRAGPGELAASGVLYLAFTSLEAMALQNAVEKRLKGTWDWLISSLDSTETQLRFGCALSNRRLTSASISPISVGGGGSSSASASAAASISHAVAFSNSAASPSTNSTANSGAGGSNAGAGASGVGGAAAGGASSSIRRLRAFQAASAAAQATGAASGAAGASGGAGSSAAAQQANADTDLLFLPALNRSSHLRRMNSLNSSTLAAGGGSVAGGRGTSALNLGASTSANTLSASDSNSSRRDFLNYAMSLMRAHSNEHYDSLPVLDVASLKHLAYVFDAFIYYMRRGLPADPNLTANCSPGSGTVYQQHPDQPLIDLTMENSTSSSSTLNPLLDISLICPPTPVPPIEPETTEESKPVINASGRASKFFRRSASTLYLGCPPPDPFSAPFHEALPLASKPHLLTPNARREQLFGVPRPSSAGEAERLLEALPSQMSLTRRTVNGGGSGGSLIFSEGGQISSATAPISKPSTSNATQSPTKTSVIVLAGSAKHPKLVGTSTLEGSQSSAAEESKSTSSSGYMGTCSVIAKAGQYNAAHADVKSLMANHYYGSQERHDALLGRWRLSLELFGRLFVDDVGLEPGSIMPELSGFPVKETKFRREMERLRNPPGSQGSHHHHSSSSGSSASNSVRDLFLKVDRDRSLLLAQTFKELNAVFAGHTRRLPSNAMPSSSYLAITRVKVFFREEPGEGSGVARGFYTAFSEAVLANEKLPALDWLLPGGPGSSSSSTTNGNSSAARSSSGYGGSPSSSSFGGRDAHSNYQFNLIRVANSSAGSSSSLAQAVSNALQGSSGGSGSPGGGSSSAPPSAAASGSSTPQDDSGLRRPRSPMSGGSSGSRLRLFSRRTNIERIRNELRTSALEDFRRSSRSSPYVGGTGSSSGVLPPSGPPNFSASASSSSQLSPASSIMLSFGGGSSGFSTSSGRHRNNSGPVLRYDSPAFVPTAAGAAASRTSASGSSAAREVAAFALSTDSRQALGSRIYSRVFPLQPANAGKITGMLLDLPSHDLIPIITSEEEFRAQVEAAMEIINAAEGGASSRTGAASALGTPPPPAPAPASSVAPPSASSSSTPSSPPEYGVESGFIDALLNVSGPSQQPPIPAAPAAASSAPAPSMLRLSDFDSLVQHHLDNHPMMVNVPSLISSSSTSSSTLPPPPPIITTAAASLPAEDNAPLFYQPGPRGFYSPRLGRGTEARLNAFRNVGRIIGICFVQNELCPITLNRQVIKYILGRPIGWHDLAFFDSDLYESLRQLILDAESPGREEVFAELDFRFAIDVSSEEGGGEVELLPGGRHLRVTPGNVLNYVQRYAMHRMVYSALPAIQALKAGVFDVLPARSFEGLTAEDFRLLLNGVNEINVSLLQSYVTFHDESGDGAEHLSYFRRWFWWVLERMTNEEKQDLVYFWTGSPALPASEEGFQPMPSITIRPRDDVYFVTANTCISRLYIPLYSTRSILRQKLLTSIKAKSFGFI